MTSSPKGACTKNRIERGRRFIVDIGRIVSGIRFEHLGKEILARYHANDLIPRVRDIQVTKA